MGEEIKQEKSEQKHEKEKGYVHQLKSQIKDLELQVKSLEEKQAEIKKQLEETQTKAGQYLSTASYYKNELDGQKKDFERLKQRSKDAEIEAETKAKENMAKKLLPIIDNFDQAIARVSDEVMKGFQMIYSSIISILADMDIEEIKCENEKLNGELHNCISVEKTDDEALDQIISKVFQKGYMFKDTKKVIRPATVSIYKKD